MNTYTISMTLDPASINAAIRELRNYQKRVQNKAEELRRRVAALIQNEAQTIFDSAVADDIFKVVVGKETVDESPRIGGVTVTVEPGDENTTLVIADGKDAIFMEFGAGVYNNGEVGSSPNPLGASLGFTIGGYGKGNGAKEVWGYRGDDGEIYITHGTPASMPLYNAIQNVIRDIVRIAEEVFS